VDDREAVVTPGTAVSAVFTTAVRSEDEPGEEDHRDDEHDPRDDADPGGREGGLGAPRLLAQNGLFG
jgi:hypothetical protein